MNKNYRIHTNIVNDTVLNVNMQQDFDFLEILSLKLSQQDAYKLHSSNYGVIVGRVLANDAFGIPNAKISIFIEKDAEDSSEMDSIYPYTSVESVDKEGRRYNILPDYSDDDCYRIVGTFPRKRLVLDNDIVLEVYDKYWKYTTVTNQAGDYMLFGVPTGSQQIHVDIDLSDIGKLSQKPRDFEYKGYNSTMFDSPNQFKESTNLSSLAQIISQNTSVFVYPFWGDANNGIAAITRSDIQVQYKFEPTCVFMGSIVSDNDGHSIGNRCAPEEENGMNDQLVGGQGTIEMIRKTSDGLVEEFNINGTQLIDENGVWCYQIPMNLDYVGTDEYGNIVPTDNPTKGIPTRAQVRFRISKTETGSEGTSMHTAKYLVPMNPVFSENDIQPHTIENGAEVEKMYLFGSNTPQNCFRDLYWNNVYSVKNYIPKVQVAHRPYSSNYSALKGSNLATDQNQIPFNKLKIDMPFLYIVVCILFTIVTYIVYVINSVFICVLNTIFSVLNILHDLCIGFICPFFFIPKIPYIGCISLGGGFSEDNTAFYPGCWCGNGRDAAECPEDMNTNKCKKSWNPSELMDRIQRNLANEFKIVKLDFYQDWINGSLYMPLWFWKKTKKRSFLFGLFSISAKNEYCSCDKVYKRLKTYVTCSLNYANNSLKFTNIRESEDKWHRGGAAKSVNYRRGVIKEVTNKDGLKAYYYTAIQPRTTNPNSTMSMDQFKDTFDAVRLYATDIILLGNLDEKNLYGIPQLFKYLPSTTANIPAIATISESSNSDDDESGIKVTNDAAITEDDGTIIVTGMDWGRHGDEQVPKYSGGLFMDITCTAASTKAKSCINVERLSELNVTIDATYNMSYSNGNTLESGVINTDGFVSKLELDDNEGRAMFATMNHMGFIPQEYQTEKGMYSTQVYDENTNYLIPKFKYVYPTNFDGRLQNIMNRYKRGFKQKLADTQDQEYLTFRLGAEEGGSKEQNNEERIRHFYHLYEMPVYNNSFYFYFGVKKGATAIDKFNKMFLSECVKNDKKPFTLDITTQGKAYCDEPYLDVKNAYGKIEIKSDDITIPYSYVLYDSRNNEIKRKEGEKETSIIIGSYISGTTKYNFDGSDTIKNKPIILANQSYKLVVTDDNGKTLTERFSLTCDQINYEYEAFRLGEKFYGDNNEHSKICDKLDSYYGKVVFDDITIDGHECQFFINTGSTDEPSYNVNATISDVSPSSQTGVIMKSVFNIDDTDKTVELLHIKFGKSNDGILKSGSTRSIDTYMAIWSETDGCLCSGDSLSVVSGYTLDNTRGKFVINVFKPTELAIGILQYCGDCNGSDIEKMSGCTLNSHMEYIEIENGDAFNAYLNEMPIKFMLNSFYDNRDMDNKPFIDEWCSVHKPTIYTFPSFNEANRYNWDDFVDIRGEINISVNSGDTLENKTNVMLFVFNSIFNLSNGVYVSGYDSQLSLTHTGGVEPILERNASPAYEYTNEIDSLLSTYIYQDTSNVSCYGSYPNIVGSNYLGVSSTSGVVNPYYSNENKLGNYFVAFTNNGGIGTEGKFIAIPKDAPVSAYKDKDKPLGSKDEVSVTKIPKVYSALTATESTYFKGMFVDRRISFDFDIMSPIMYELPEDISDSEYTKGYIIKGDVLGGILMSYDDNYNVISADSITFEDEDNTITWYSGNSCLEYTYDTYTTNVSDITRMIEYNDSNTVVPKRFYSATINGEDVRDYLSADVGFSADNFLFNKGSIEKYQLDDNVSHNINITSCSYNIKTSTDENGRIDGITSPGETASISANFKHNLIKYISGGNVLNPVPGPTGSTKSFTAGTDYDYTFSFTTNGAINGYDVYPKVPKILMLEKSEGGLNSISEYKNKIVNGEPYSGLIDFNPIRLPDGVTLKNDGFFYLQREKLAIDDTELQNVTFQIKGSDENGFVVVSEREYVGNIESMLKNNVHTYEFSNAYIPKEAEITITLLEGQYSPEVENTPPGTYVYSTEGEQTGSDDYSVYQHFAFSASTNEGVEISEVYVVISSLTRVMGTNFIVSICSKRFKADFSGNNIFEVIWDKNNAPLDTCDGSLGLLHDLITDDEDDDTGVQIQFEIGTTDGAKYIISEKFTYGWQCIKKEIPGYKYAYNLKMNFM